MSVTRNNHYVPQWYQEGFFEPNENTLAYLNMKPEEKILPDGLHFGRGQQLLEQRERIKRKTIEQRRLQNQKQAA